MKIPDETMHERRLDRLKHVEFFLRQKGLRTLALSSTHNLLTGFFENSYWRVASYCLKQAISNSWTNLRLDLWFYWNRKVLKLNDEELNDKIDIEAGARTETCLKCGWQGLETHLILEETDEWTDAFCPKCKESIFKSLFVADDKDLLEAK